MVSLPLLFICVLTGCDCSMFATIWSCLWALQCKFSSIRSSAYLLLDALFFSYIIFVLQIHFNFVGSLIHSTFTLPCISSTSWNIVWGWLPCYDDRSFYLKQLEISTWNVKLQAQLSLCINIQSIQLSALVRLWMLWSKLSDREIIAFCLVFIRIHQLFHCHALNYLSIGVFCLLTSISGGEVIYFHRYNNQQSRYCSR